MFCSVYRVEKNGTGPYRRSDHGDQTEALAEMKERHNEDMLNHPSPFYERCGFAKANYDEDFNYFGFESIDQLEAWFSVEERIMLMLEGFEIVRHTVIRKNVFFGNKQVCFKGPVGMKQKIDW